MNEHLDKYERCKNCYHFSSCDAWIKHGTTLYDDYEYSVEDCTYYIPAANVVEVVRCKNCHYCDKYTKWNGEEYYGCSFTPSEIHEVEPMHYCGHGAKRTEETKMAEAICKRCIHHDICDSYSGFDIVTFFPYNEDCEYFKSRHDYAEVQYGEWIKTRYPEVHRCSVCKQPTNTRQGFPNYCPECGANMVERMNK